MAPESLEQFALRVMSGQQRGPAAALLRGALAAAEPLYAAATWGRNLLFDAGVGVARLPRPVLSVGNLTAGGTGKTPVVIWLAGKLREQGWRPAVLLRGYKSAGGRSDEAAVLDAALNPPGVAVPVAVGVNPRRLAGGLAVLARRPDVGVFVLDDGFQHRKLARDFDLVLIDALEPFGFGHVHPRGLLREPLRGLRRADAVVLTRSDQVGAGRRAWVERQVRRHHPGAPIYHARHAHAGLRAEGGWRGGPAGEATVRDAGGASGNTDRRLPLGALAGRRFFAFCGIGNPEGFARQLRSLPGECVGQRWFADHYGYGERDVLDLSREAAAAGAELLLTTEKDWVKLAALPTVAREAAVKEAGTDALPVWRVELSLEFAPGHEEQLFEQVLACLKTTR